ncbi:hypothetical protein NHX12_016080 [Muraenolepis orangiensis]|uniref:NACHT domain-containing protein n=1 Tax=Muraenolepis orangiensis TaxID=630683 RepID=A0A9Q0D4W2_9TELE|nr:hypothetical protein NHX12_016080 [Muraenolepis orangiensis]
MQKFRRVFEGIAKAGQSTDLNDFYTELFITERVSGEVNKEHEVRLIETASRKPAKEETPIKLEDIFKPLPGQDQPSRTIMTTGVAGIGKTILTHKFTLDWAEGKANHDIHFTLPFTFRELNLLKEKEFSLMELLHHFFIQTKGIRRYDLFQVVFILDGLDECRLPLDFQNNPIWTDVTKSTSVDVLLTNLIRGDLLPSARIWITTRPAAANQIPAECVGMVTEAQNTLTRVGLREPSNVPFIGMEELSDGLVGGCCQPLRNSVMGWRLKPRGGCCQPLRNSVMGWRLKPRGGCCQPLRNSVMGWRLKPRGGCCQPLRNSVMGWRLKPRGGCCQPLRNSVMGWRLKLRGGCCQPLRNSVMGWRLKPRGGFSQPLRNSVMGWWLKPRGGCCQPLRNSVMGWWLKPRADAVSP